MKIKLSSQNKTKQQFDGCAEPVGCDNEDDQVIERRAKPGLHNSLTRCYNTVSFCGDRFHQVH